MYLFKNAQDKWIFGNTIHSECPAGVYRVNPSSDLTTLSIHLVTNNLPIVRNESVGNFLKADGTAYANFTELQTGYDGFFESKVEAEVSGTDLDVRPLVNTDVVSAEQSDATKLRMTEASAADIKTAIENIYDWDESDRAKVNPIVGQAGIAAGAGQTTQKTQRIVAAKPDYVDTTSSTVLYEGYFNGMNYDICKIDLSTAVISRTWATGAWGDRVNLFTT